MGVRSVAIGNWDAGLEAMTSSPSSGQSVAEGRLTDREKIKKALRCFFTRRVKKPSKIDYVVQSG